MLHEHYLTIHVSLGGRKEQYSPLFLSVVSRGPRVLMQRTAVNIAVTLFSPYPANVENMVSS